MKHLAKILIVLLIISSGYLFYQNNKLESKLITQKTELKKQIEKVNSEIDTIFYNNKKRADSVQKRSNQIVISYEKFKQKIDTTIITTTFRNDFIAKLEAEARLQRISK